jgi:D-alanyl-D-alanine dipeptidase
MKHLNEPISQDYRICSLSSINKGTEMVPVESKNSIKVANAYFISGHDGTYEKLFIRKTVLEKIELILSDLGDEFGIIIFDAFRSKATQMSIYKSFFNEISAREPHWDLNKIEEETKKFVAHPDDKARFEVSPHNSGGAIDLTFTYKNLPLNMGTEFDDLTTLAQTNYFEKEYLENSCFSLEEWMSIRNNRRILFNSMKRLGFTNYPEEWWHYDFGNCLWSNFIGEKWFFDSADEDVKALKVSSI